MKNLTYDWVSHVVYWTTKLQLTLESADQSEGVIDSDIRDQITLYVEAASKAAERAIAMNDESTDHLYHYYLRLLEWVKSPRSISNDFEKLKMEIDDIFLPVRELSITTLKHIKRH